MNRQLMCVTCGSTYPLEARRLRCDCGGLLDVQIDVDGAPSPEALVATFESRLVSRLPQDLSGVWRYRELVLDLPADDIVTFPEGRTNLYTLDPTPLGLSALWAKHEGENPTGSFKDRGMIVAVSWARHQGAQALAYGAHTLQIDGGFDDAMHAVEQMATTHNLTLVNSLNPFRLEGQKTIILDSFFQLGNMLPDWIVVPGGNLGNTSAFGKALIEMKALGLIDRVPRLAVIQAEGASPFARAAQGNFQHFEPMQPETVATAIRIGNPVNYDKAVRAIRFTSGVVTSVTDAEILQAKHDLDRQAIGCEPASAATLAGLRRLTREHVVRPGESALLIITGNLLKDPDTTIALATGQTAALGVTGAASLDACANGPRHVPSDPETIAGIIEEELR